MSDVLQQAILAINIGEKARAGQLLTEILRADPKNTDAWIWLAHIANSEAWRRACLDQALAINLAFSSNGKFLASGAEDGVIRRWDVSGGQPFGKPLTDYTNPVRNLAFSPNDHFLAWGDDQGGMMLWEGDNVQTLLSHAAPVSSPGF